MRDFKACLFDLDGVIVDTAKYHYLAWKRLADELDFEFTLQHNERLKGVSRMRSLEILLEVGGKSFPLHEMEKMAAKKNEWYVEYISKLEPDAILPGVLRFLNDLKEHGIRIALGSASKNAQLILERIGISAFFDVVIDGTKVSNPKPHPEVFLKGASELGIEPALCIVFEDAQAGVEAARNGNMRCVGIGNIENLTGADIVIPGFEGVTFNYLLKKLK